MVFNPPSKKVDKDLYIQKQFQGFQNGLKSWAGFNSMPNLIL